jgi:hypothetical protein
MAKKISAANAAVSACVSAAALFGVPAYRMQSRVVTVVGAGGGNRPMFIGEWIDDMGVKHYRGMADLLLTPCIDPFTLCGVKGQFFIPMNQRADLPMNRIAVPLWVECKSGSGELEPEQKLFRDRVVSAGNFYVEAHDSADAVIAWFQQMGVRR